MKEENSENNIKVYEETCEILRHYSKASFNVRALSIIQGIGLLTGWLFNYGKEDLLLIIIPFFGILFTWLLYRFHKGYFLATEFFYEVASKMEENLFDEDFRPFKIYDKRHKTIYKSRFSKVTVLDAPFTLIGISFIAIMIISILSYLQIM